MKRNKTMKLALIAALSIAPFGWANAFCHAIQGQWVATYDEVSGGNTIAGVGNAIIDSTTIRYWAAESSLGMNRLYMASGPWTIDQFCNFVWTYTADDGTSGVANGVVVNVNQLNVVFTNTTLGRSGRVIFQRLEFFN